MNPTTIGASLQERFTKLSNQLTNPGEISLFTALQKALLQTSTQLFEVEILHGSKYQVWHDTCLSLGLMPRRRRCELSDLLVVSFDPRQAGVRATFLQAKHSRRTIKLKKPAAVETFSADMVQWSLLSHQPIISGAARFQPPQDLLQSAILPSVGSFGFFYWHPSVGHDLLYSSADVLAASYSPGQKRGKLEVLADDIVHCRNGHQELVTATDLKKWGTGLACNAVGTPVTPTLATWLASILRRTNGVLAKEAITHLPPSDTDSPDEEGGGEEIITIGDTTPPDTPTVIVLKTGYGHLPINEFIRSRVVE